MDMTFVGWQLILHEILNGIITYFYYVRWKPPSLNLTLIAMAIFLISLFGEVGGTLFGIVVKIKNMIAQQRESKEKVRRMSVGVFDSTVNMLKGLYSVVCRTVCISWLHRTHIMRFLWTLSLVMDRRMTFVSKLATKYNINIVHKMIGMADTDSQPETCELLKWYWETQSCLFLIFFNKFPFLTFFKTNFLPVKVCSYLVKTRYRWFLFKLFTLFNLFKLLKTLIT